MKLILASSSIYRKELLSKLQLPFDIQAPDIDESPTKDETPPDLVKRLAIEKAKAIADNAENSLVIGCDQVAVHGDTIVGKPRDHDHAVQQLKTASGTTVMLYTGLALINSDTSQVQSEVVPYKVKFRKLTDEQIENYLQKEQPYHCAGSVKSEGLGIALLEKFAGDDPNTLIGLPLIRLIKMLEREGMTVI